jgi:hypothetical protein
LLWVVALVLVMVLTRDPVMLRVYTWQWWVQCVQLMRHAPT